MANRLLLIVFFLLSIANLVIYINRNNGFEYVKQSSYQELYPNTNKGISTISIEKDSIAIIDLKGFPSSVKWNIACNDVVFAQNQLSPVHFPLKQNTNRYILQANDSAIKQIVIDLDYAPAELYKKNGSSVGTNYEIRYSNLPFVTSEPDAVNKWKDTMDYIDATELNAVKKILNDSLHIKATDSAITKIKIIDNYIYQSVKHSIGIPPDSLSKYSVYKQFCLAKNHQTKIWCGNISDIVHLFTTAAGVVSRNIGFTGNRQIFSTGSHAANESYLPETGEWAYTDITQNILLLTDTTGKILNTVDLYHLKKLNQTGNIVSYSSGDSAIVKGSYSNPDKKYVWGQNEILFPHPYDPATLYSWSNKLQRYFSRNPWLEIYSETTVYDNSKFYLKTYLLYTWVIAGLLILGSFIKIKKRR